MVQRLASVLLACVLALAAPAAAEEVSPEETLKRYLAAIQSQQFEKAYDLITQGMRRGRSKEAWVKESQYVMAFSEAKIFDFKVGKAKVTADKALVPNLLESQDKFLNQLGVPEQEIYTLIKEEGAWKVDQQKIAEGAELKEFFPEADKKP